MCIEWLLFASKCEHFSAAKLTWLFSLGMKQAFKNLLCFFLSVSGVSSTVSISSFFLHRVSENQKVHGQYRGDIFLISQTVSVQWSVTRSQDFLHPHPVDEVMLTFTILYMKFVGGQEFWSREEPDPFWDLQSGRCAHCSVDNEDYNTLVFDPGDVWTTDNLSKFYRQWVLSFVFPCKAFMTFLIILLKSSKVIHLSYCTVDTGNVES